ncbi:MAG TPA: hypothetical protein VHZ24_07455 [Pirellulales bacterium]|nr:hypothetical protein [Pirellulales bacterium]
MSISSLDAGGLGAAGYGAAYPVIVNPARSTPAATAGAGTVSATEQNSSAVAGLDGRGHGIHDSPGQRRAGYWHQSLAPLMPEPFGNGSEDGGRTLGATTGLSIDLRA